MTSPMTIVDLTRRARLGDHGREGRARSVNHSVPRGYDITDPAYEGASPSRSVGRKHADRHTSRDISACSTSSSWSSRRPRAGLYPRTRPEIDESRARYDNVTTASTAPLRHPQSSYGARSATFDALDTLASRWRQGSTSPAQDHGFGLAALPTSCSSTRPTSALPVHCAVVDTQPSATCASVLTGHPRP